MAQANDPFSDNLTVSLVGATKTVVVGLEDKFTSTVLVPSPLFLHTLALPRWLCPAIAWAPTVSQEATAGHVLHVAFLRSS